MATDLDLIKKGLKCGIIDIETTGLEADYDYMICACIRTVGNGTWTVRIDDRRNKDKFSDKWLLKQLVKKMNEYDLLIGWYSSGFDFPFINARCFKHKIKPPEKKYRRDLCFVSRGNFRLSNNKLQTVHRFGFGQSDKTYITGDIKHRAIRGDEWAIDFYVTHNRIDVKETESLYLEMMPLLGKLRKGG